MKKSEIQNFIDIKESDLLKTHSLVNPKKNEVYQTNDLVVIYELKGILTCAKLSGASYLIRKHLDIFAAIKVYRLK